jgi:hypothetical protein
MVIEIKPHRWGWKAFEALGVEPVFPQKDQAIDYAKRSQLFICAHDEAFSFAPKRISNPDPSPLQIHC